MKILVSLAGLFIIVGGGLYLLNNYIFNQQNNEKQTPTITMNTPQIIPIEHATGIIRWGDTVFYTDPVGGPEKFAGQAAPSIILLTDIHGDHLSTSTLAAVIGNATLIVPPAVKDLLPADLAARAKVLQNGETITEQGFHILAMPMYNLPAADNAKFHTKGRGNGYVIEKDGIRVYVAGDTAGIPEMRALRDIDIALIPMNLPYTMSVEDAADAVLEFKPKKVYPYHYRGPDGLADVEKFKQLVNAGDPSIEVALANWYPKP